MLAFIPIAAAPISSQDITSTSGTGIGAATSASRGQSASIAKASGICVAKNQSASVYVINGTSTVAGIGIAISANLYLYGSAYRQSSNWQYTASGGIDLGGVYYAVHQYNATGGISTGGAANLSTTYIYAPGGGIKLGGVVSTESIYYQYCPFGGVLLGGSAFSNNYNLGTFVINAQGSFSTVDLMPDYSIYTNGPPIPSTTSIISTSCNCNILPAILSFTHNLASAGMLSQFLQRNNRTLTSALTMSYDNNNQLWRTNIHYRGMGNNGGTESWNILFSWQCTNLLGPYDLGSSVWVFSLYAVQRNSLSNNDRETRLVLSFTASSALCANPQFDFEIDMNTKTQLVTTDPAAVLNSQILYDGIGLFSSSQWLTNPILTINITNATTTSFVSTINITPFIVEATI